MTPNPAQSSRIASPVFHPLRIRGLTLALLLACGSAGAADKPVTVGQEGEEGQKALKDLVIDKKANKDALTMPLEGGNATSKYILNPEYSKETGTTVTGAYGTMLGDNAAIGGILTVGGRKKEGILNLGYRSDRQQIVITLDQLRQSLNFDFLSGSERVEMVQNSAAASYKFKLSADSRNFFELNAYRLRTDSRSLDDVIVVTDTATFFETASVQRRVAGGEVDGFQGQFAFAPFASSAFKTSLGQERLQYGLAAGDRTTRRRTSGLEWNQQLPAGYSFTAAANIFAAQKRYGIGVERCLAGGQQIGFDLIRIRGRDGAPDDSQARLTWAVKLGGRPGCSPRVPSLDPSDSAPTWRGWNLLDQVVLRPDFLPSQVVAIPDETAVPRRLVGVDKTQLPPGSTVGRDGIITVPLGVCVPGITGVTRNGAAFTNTGQFTVPPSCTTLVIDPGRLPPRAGGSSDTYVVTTGTPGSCAAMTTVTVAATGTTVAGVSSAGCDTTPNPFSFAAQANVPVNTLVESNAITVSGINSPAAISVAGGEYQVDGGAWTTMPASVAGGKSGKAVVNGQTVRVRHTSAATNSTSVNTTLTIGGVSATFTSTTVAAAVTNAAPTITGLPSLPSGVRNGTSVPLSVTFGDDKPFAALSITSVSAAFGSISGFVGGAYGTRTFTYTAPVIVSPTAPTTEVLTFSVTDSDGVTTTATVTFPIT